MVLVAAAAVAVAGAVGWGLWRRSSPEAGGAAAWRLTTLPDAPTPEETELLRAVASAAPGDPAPARQLGDYYLGQARPFLALWAYADAVARRPDDPDTNLGLARALEAGLLHEAAEARLRALVARHPDRHDAVMALADLYLRTGRPREALTVAFATGPPLLKSSEGSVLEGRAREALGEYDAAKKAYRRAVDQNSRDGSAWRRLGLLALARGEIFDAQQALGAARVVDPGPRRSVDLGRAFAASPKPEERRRAPEFYVEAMNRSLEYAPAHYEAGLWYLRQSRWAEAIERLRFAVTSDPKSADAAEMLARALEATGQEAEAHRFRGFAADARDLRAVAVREFEAWARLAPNDPEAPLQVAQEYFRINQLEKARARLEKARQRFPKHAGIRERLIAFHLLAGDRKAARALLEEWRKEEPGAVRVLWMLGRAAADEGRLEEAVGLYEQAVAKEPGNAEFHHALGEALLKLPNASRQTDRAVGALARAATLAPDEARYRATLAQALRQAGRAADARRQALRALDLDPHQGPVYSVVVQLARQEGARAPLALFAPLVRAVEDRLREEAALWQATWERPDDPRAHEALADFLIRTGDLAAAEGQLLHADRLRSTPRSRERLAWIRRLRQVQ